MEVIRKLKSLQGEYKNFLAENTRNFALRFYGTYIKGSSRAFVKVSERDFTIKNRFYSKQSTAVVGDYVNIVKTTSIISKCKK